MNGMESSGFAYGLWSIVIFNSILFIGFLVSFAKPQTKVEWRTFGAFSAFLVALFVEMYGFPLTIYLLSGWLGSQYPVANPFSHENGHLLSVFLGLGTGHFSFIHIVSNILIIAGALIISSGWRSVHAGQGGLVTDGLYRYVRHPQYSGFIVVIIGFLIQWPTLVTLAMAPILIYRYVRLSKKEENWMLERHGEEYRKYMDAHPRFIPRLKEVLHAQQQT